MIEMSREKYQEFDARYTDLFNALEKFFRFHQDNEIELSSTDVDYYEKVAKTLMTSISHEITYLGKWKSWPPM